MLQSHKDQLNKQFALCKKKIERETSEMHKILEDVKEKRLALLQQNISEIEKTIQDQIKNISSLVKKLEEHQHSMTNFEKLQHLSNLIKVEQILEEDAELVPTFNIQSYSTQTTYFKSLQRPVKIHRKAKYQKEDIEEFFTNLFHFYCQQKQQNCICEECLMNQQLLEKQSNLVQQVKNNPLFKYEGYCILKNK